MQPYSRFSSWPDEQYDPRLPPTQSTQARSIYFPASAPQPNPNSFNSPLDAPHFRPPIGLFSPIPQQSSIDNEHGNHFLSSQNIGGEQPQFSHFPNQVPWPSPDQYSTAAWDPAQPGNAGVPSTLAQYDDASSTPAPARRRRRQPHADEQAQTTAQANNPPYSATFPATNEVVATDSFNYTREQQQHPVPSANQYEPSAYQAIDERTLSELRQVLEENTASELLDISNENYTWSGVSDIHTDLSGPQASSQTLPGTQRGLPELDPGHLAYEESAGLPPLEEFVDSRYFASESATREPSPPRVAPEETAGLDLFAEFNNSANFDFESAAREPNSVESVQEYTAGLSSTSGFPDLSQFTHQPLPDTDHAVTPSTQLIWGPDTFHPSALEPYAFESHVQNLTMPAQICLEETNTVAPAKLTIDTSAQDPSNRPLKRQRRRGNAFEERAQNLSTPTHAGLEPNALAPSLLTNNTAATQRPQNPRRRRRNAFENNTQNQTSLSMYAGLESNMPASHQLTTNSPPPILDRHGRPRRRARNGFDYNRGDAFPGANTSLEVPVPAAAPNTAAGPSSAAEKPLKKSTKQSQKASKKRKRQHDDDGGHQQAGDAGPSSATPAEKTTRAYVHQPGIKKIPGRTRLLELLGYWPGYTGETFGTKEMANSYEIRGHTTITKRYQAGMRVLYGNNMKERFEELKRDYRSSVLSEAERHERALYQSIQEQGRFKLSDPVRRRLDAYNAGTPRPPLPPNPGLQHPSWVHPLRRHLYPQRTPSRGPTPSPATSD